MADTKKKLMSKDAVEKLEAELNDLLINQRTEIAEKIKEAREQGDLSENAEYEAARDEQRLIEARIEELQKMLQHVEIMDDDDDESLEFVKLNNVVTILDIEMEEELKYHLVSAVEPKLLGGELTIDSPLGEAVLGKKVGDMIEVEAPAGMIQYKITGIDKYKGDK